ISAASNTCRAIGRRIIPGLCQPLPNPSRGDATEPFGHTRPVLVGARRSDGPPVLLWPASLLVWGPGAVRSLHAHHAIQLLLTLDGRARLRGRARQPWADFTAALVGPDVPHEVDARGTTVVIAFVDPESEVGAGLRRRLVAPLIVLPAAEIAGCRR